MMLAVAGAVVGLLVGVSGVGGGSLLTPLLVLGFGLPPTAAVSSDLTVTAVMRLVGAAVHQTRRGAHLGVVLWLSVTGVPAALVGPVVTRIVGPTPALEHALTIALGVVLLGASVLTAWSGGNKRPAPARAPDQNRPVPDHATDQDRPVRRGQLALLGAATGLLVGFTSVGSGSIVMAVLLLTHPEFSPVSLVATDLVQGLPMVLAAAIGQLLLGDFHATVAWPLLLGGVPGVVVGALLAPLVRTRLLRGLLVVLLASAGASMLTKSLVAMAATAAVMVALVLLRSRSAPAPAPVPQHPRATSDT